MFPLVSIIIPTYNRAHVIERAIISIQKQDYVNYEIIVCDDASTDNTVLILNKIAEKDSRLVIICLEENQGSGTARTKAMQIAKGKYITFLDSDDEWLPRKLSYQVKAMENSSDKVGGCLTGAKYYKNEARPVSRVPKKIWEIDPLQSQLRGELTWATAALMIRRSCLDTIGYMAPELRRGQDTDFFFRLLMYYNIITIQKVLVIIHLSIGKRMHFDHVIKKELYMMTSYYNQLINIRGINTANQLKAFLAYEVLYTALCERHYIYSFKYIIKYIILIRYSTKRRVLGILKSLLIGLLYW